jgi:hypothetical protein
MVPDPFRPCSAETGNRQYGCWFMHVSETHFLGDVGSEIRKFEGQVPLVDAI